VIHGGKKKYIEMFGSFTEPFNSLHCPRYFQSYFPRGKQHAYLAANFFGSIATILKWGGYYACV